MLSNGAQRSVEAVGYCSPLTHTKPGSQTQPLASRSESITTVFHTAVNTLFRIFFLQFLVHNAVALKKKPTSAHTNGKKFADPFHDPPNTELFVCPVSKTSTQDSVPLTYQRSLVLHTRCCSTSSTLSTITFSVPVLGCLVL